MSSQNGEGVRVNYLVNSITQPQALLWPPKKKKKKKKKQQQQKKPAGPGDCAVRQFNSRLSLLLHDSFSGSTERGGL
jgi:hypothetical protein